MSRRLCTVTWACLYLLAGLGVVAVFFAVCIAVLVLITHLFGSNAVLGLSLVLLVSLLTPFAVALANNHCEKP